MKKQAIIPAILISLAYLSLIFLTLYFRENLSQSINIDGSDPFSAIILIVYGIHVIK